MYNIHIASTGTFDHFQKGNTPLHVAALGNKADIVRLLIRKGANVNSQARVSNCVYILL